MYTFLSLHSLLYRNRLGSVRVSAGIVVFKNSIDNVALLSIDNFPQHFNAVHAFFSFLSQTLAQDQIRLGLIYMKKTTC